MKEIHAVKKLIAPLGYVNQQWFSRLKPHNIIRKVVNVFASKYGSRYGFTVNWFYPNSPKWKIISLKPQNGNRGNVLLSYRTEPFLPESKSLLNKHSAYWECYQMAKTFLDRGYAVDVIHWLNDRYVPKKKYSFFIDIYLNLERIGVLINGDCIKIYHIVRAHWLFQNKAEYQRIDEVKKRKGFVLKPRRQMGESLAIENADFITGKGNDFTFGTYGYAQKPIYHVPLVPITTYPWQEKKDFEKCKKHFLWMGSEGLIHKGLDLVLEAFKEMPDHNLTVCGPIKDEKDFERLYFDELYNTPNITTKGWVDVTKDEFVEITKRCVAIVYPSASEGQAGCVINCMHAGLIPVISNQCGVDVTEDYGMILKNCSIEGIKNSVWNLSRLSSQKLKEMSKNAWNIARNTYTREEFAKKYGEAIDEILEQVGGIGLNEN